ncbi:MAG TPA: response regulator [Terriglobia bacterium]|nr:response regulator [Terriglobia bacterium]
MAKILLADDSTHAQRMGTKILVAEGHEVSTVSNGQAAIHALEQAAPELVIADVFMPGKNGYEVCQFVKSSDRLKSIPVLLIIGAMEPYDPEQGRRAGADGLITKPLESSALASTVNDLLAAAKRFPPARPLGKQTAPDKLAEQPLAAEPSAQWEETSDELITPSALPKIEIPEEISQQPIGMFTDLMAEEPAAMPSLMEEAAAMPTVEALREAESAEEAQEMTPPVRLTAAPVPPASLVVEESAVWTAEPAEVTEEEARLFDQPAADWRDLEQLVSKAAAEPPSALSASAAMAAAEPPQPEPAPPGAPLSWPTASAKAEPITMSAMEFGLVGAESGAVSPDPLLIRPEETPAQVDTDPEIEHYENLDAVVEAQGPVHTIRAPEPPPEFPGPVEELEASPEERNLPPLEQLVRQAIEDLLPEIIDRVKQSLKG